MEKKYIDDRIKILRTASQSLIALYLIGTVLVLSVFEKSPYEKAKVEVDALKDLKKELRLTELNKFIATKNSKDKRAFSLISNEVKSEVSHRIITLFSAFGNNPESYGSDLQMTYEFSDGEHSDFDVVIPYSAIEMPNIVQGDIPKLNTIQDWYNLFEKGMEIGVIFPTINFLDSRSMLVLENGNSIIEKVYEELSRDSYIDFLELTTHRLDSLNLIVRCNPEGLDFGSCTEEAVLKLNFKSKYINYDLSDSGQTEVLNFDFDLYPDLEDQNTILVNVSFSDYLSYMQETERIVKYDSLMFSDILYSDSGYILPNISALFDEISQRELDNAEYYLYSKQNEVDPISFFGVTISRLLSSVTFPLLVMVLIIYHLFHLKRVEIQENYFPWIPLQKGGLEIVYSNVIYIFLPATISIFLFSDEKLIDEKIIFSLSLSFTVINLALGTLLVLKLSEKSA